MIEEGRTKRPKIPRDERICLLCTEEVEDEIHFLINVQAKTPKEIYYLPKYQNLYHCLAL